MARKNLLAGIDEKLTAVNSETDTPRPPPMPPRSLAGRGAFGAVTRSIDDLAARADAAKELEARLIAGDVIVDLDPGKIDRSPVADRMGHDDESYRALLDGIRNDGQGSPILVRPHPTAPGRYQVAFGHRRLQAARDLGRPVRAVVKPLTDRELVIAQGQENSARANLSFIERARFAHRLEDAGYDRETIMSALSVDKTTVSRLISVTTRIPEAVIDAVGPAPSVGRDKWIALASLFQGVGDESTGREHSLAGIMDGEEFAAAASDLRFELVEDRLSRKGRAAASSEGEGGERLRARGQARFWSAKDGTKVAKITTNERAFILAIDRRVAPDFGDYLLGELDRLYRAYAKGRTKE